MNKHQIVSWACVILSIISIVVLLCLRMTTDADFRVNSVESLDREIAIKWTAPIGERYSKVIVEARDIDGKSISTDSVPASNGSYSFVDGIHGQKYCFDIRAVKENGDIETAGQYDRVFLDYDKLPSLPLLIVETENNVNPTYEVVTPNVEGLEGSTIGNNEFVKCVFSGKGDEFGNLSLGGKIKVRGNTSSLNSPKKSYRIELNSPIRIGDEENVYKSWNLLNNGSNLKTLMGCHIGEMCGMEWQPKMTFVNLMLNGDWQGCYCMIPAVGRETAGSLVDGSGYIFENDSYWWSDTGATFKTSYQEETNAYTFKFPNILNPDDNRLLKLKDYMDSLEEAVYNDNGDYESYIDEDTWISWILSRDIIANLDGGGTNAFYYIKSFGEGNDADNKVKMGPLWDFDRAFEDYDTWSHCRNASTTYFEQMFMKDAFVEKYKRRWGGLSSNVYTEVSGFLDNIEAEHGEELQKSYMLDSAKWGEPIESFESQKEYIRDWIVSHVSWMNMELAMPNSINVDISGFEEINDSIVGTVDGIYPTDDCYCCQGWAFINADIPSEGNLRTCVMQGDELYLTRSFDRWDVFEQYNLEKQDVGFYTYVSGPDTPQICMVDFDNKIIYR